METGTDRDSGQTDGTAPPYTHHHPHPTFLAWVPASWLPPPCVASMYLISFPQHPDLLSSAWQPLDLSLMYSQDTAGMLSMAAFMVPFSHATIYQVALSFSMSTSLLWHAVTAFPTFSLPPPPNHQLSSISWHELSMVQHVISAACAATSGSSLPSSSPPMLLLCGNAN